MFAKQCSLISSVLQLRWTVPPKVYSHDSNVVVAIVFVSFLLLLLVLLSRNDWCYGRGGALNAVVDQPPRATPERDYPFFAVLILHIFRFVICTPLRLRITLSQKLYTRYMVQVRERYGATRQSGQNVIVKMWVAPLQ